MKNSLLPLVLSITILISCSKSEEEATVLFEVVEYKTNTPVKSVQIDLLNCSYYDLVFGCQSTGIVATGFTDQDGKCFFKQSVLNRSSKGSKLQKLKYWDADAHPGKNYIVPESWINIHLIRQNVYSVPRLFFRYDIYGESGNARINPFTVPNDTIIKVRAFGNELNKINWEIGSGIIASLTDWNRYSVTPILANGTVPQSTNAFDTASITLLY